MLSRGAALVLDRLARLVTSRRLLIIVPIVALTTVLGFQIPNLEADPAPERLLASYEDDAAATSAKRFDTAFAETEDVMVVLVEAADVLEPRYLQYVHEISRHFEGRDSIRNVRSITTMPLPRFEGASGAATLDDLEQDEPLDLDDLEAEGEGEVTLDDLEAEGGEQAIEGGDPAVLDALSDLVDSAPEHFPMGLGGLAARLDSQLVTDPVVEGDEVTEAEAAELARVLQDAPLIEGRLISADHTVAVVVLELAASPEERHEAVQAATRAIETYVHDHPPPEGAQVHLGGLPHLRGSIVDKMQTDRRVLMPLTVLVCLVILWLSYRWFVGTLLPMLAVGVTAVVVVGGMAVFGQQMNVLTNIIPPLLVIIGICESIHLVGRYREELAQGDGRVEAGQRTVRTMAVACMLASLTTAVGLGSLVVSGSVMLRHFGIIAALGVMVAYVVTVTFLPSLLSAFPPPRHVERTERKGLERAVVLVTEAVLRKPWAVLAATAVLLGLSVWGATNVRVDHALLDQFDEDDPVYQTTRLMEDKLEGIRPLQVYLESAGGGSFYDPALLAHLEEVNAWASDRPEVLQALGPSDILLEAWVLLTGDAGARDEAFRSENQVRALATLLDQRETSPLKAFISGDGERARLTLRLRDVGAQKTLHFIDDLEGEMEDTFSAGTVNFSFAGDAYRGSRSLRAVVTDLLSSLLMAIGIIFLLMTLLLRSLRLGLLSIPSNVIPLVVTMAYMVVRGIPLNAATVIIFSISIGLAVDSTIHVLARYREETLKGLGSSEALLRAARGTGQAIVVSNVTLMAGFAVLTASSFVPVRNFGELIAVTVGGCLVATLVVQPALLKIAGLPRRAELEAASL